MLYDKERLLSDATSDVVVNYLGIETRRQGPRTSILCPHPGHDDRNFGNCFLTEKGFYCFACNKGGGIIDLVMHVEHVGFNEALGLIGDALGGRRLYAVDNTTVSKDAPHRFDKEKGKAYGLGADSEGATAITIAEIASEPIITETLLAQARREQVRRCDDMLQRLKRTTGQDASRIIDLLGDESGCVSDDTWHQIHAELKRRKLEAETG